MEISYKLVVSVFRYVALSHPTSAPAKLIRRHSGRPYYCVSPYFLQNCSRENLTLLALEVTAVSLHVAYLHCALATGVIIDYWELSFRELLWWELPRSGCYVLALAALRISEIGTFGTLAGHACNSGDQFGAEANTCAGHDLSSDHVSARCRNPLRSSRSLHCQLEDMIIRVCRSDIMVAAVPQRYL